MVQVGRERRDTTQVAGGDSSGHRFSRPGLAGSALPEEQKGRTGAPVSIISHCDRVTGQVAGRVQVRGAADFMRERVADGT